MGFRLEILDREHLENPLFWFEENSEKSPWDDYASLFAMAIGEIYCGAPFAGPFVLDQILDEETQEPVEPREFFVYPMWENMEDEYLVNRRLPLFRIYEVIENVES